MCDERAKLARRGGHAAATRDAAAQRTRIHKVTPMCEYCLNTALFFVTNDKYVAARRWFVDHV